MAHQLPARTLTAMRERDIPVKGTCLVAVDARTLRRALLANPGRNIRAVVSEALSRSYPSRATVRKAVRAIRGK